MFGDIDLDYIDIGELEIGATKELQKEATTAEEAHTSRQSNLGLHHLHSHPH